jgi:hypothetical protein
MGDFPQSLPISFLSPLTLKLIKGVRAVERVGLMFAEVRIKGVFYIT